MQKNLSPKKIALYMSILLSVFILTAEIVIEYFFHSRGLIFKTILFGISSFLFFYFIFFITIQTFIYNKIKLIYKTIYNFKTANTSQNNLDFNKDIISDVNQEVLEWATDKKEEIEVLKRQEIFRREFLGNVSHELKTPIFSIQGYIHTLLDGGIDDEHINILYLEKASRSVDRLCTIVDDLDAISKLESGELILEQRVFDITDLTKEIFDSLEMKAKKKNIYLEFANGSEKSVFVHADKEKIRQVLVNLIVNSLKYGRPNTETTVGFYDMDQNILVEVADRGIGIEEEHLPRLFERFYRVDKSRSRDQGGTGLGLAIVKHIIEAHYQTINVRSTIGVGSTFSFTLKKGKG